MSQCKHRVSMLITLNFWTGFLMMQIFLLLHLKFSPFESNQKNSLQTFGLAIQMLTLFLGVILSVSRLSEMDAYVVHELNASPLRRIVDTLLMLINVLMPILQLSIVLSLFANIYARAVTSRNSIDKVCSDQMCLN